MSEKKIYVAGHTGLLGSAVLRRLKAAGYGNIVVRPHKQLDLAVQAEVEEFFSRERPGWVILSAGMTGGILANMNYPADFFHANIAIQDNVFEAALKYGADGVVFFGSSCIYPREIPQPIREEYLLKGEIEETSEAYAIAKIAGIKACSAYNRQYGSTRFIALVPNSVYGPNDNFHPRRSHVLSALIRKFADAKEDGLDDVLLWGTGEPRREFVYCDDVADAAIFAMERAGELENRHYNVGTGVDCSIRELAEMIAAETGFTGRIIWDTGKPDGVFRKLLDSSSFESLGWKAATGLREGIKRTYEWYRSIGRGREATVWGEMQA